MKAHGSIVNGSTRYDTLTHHNPQYHFSQNLSCDKTASDSRKQWCDEARGVRWSQDGQCALDIVSVSSPHQVSSAWCHWSVTLLTWHRGHGQLLWWGTSSRWQATAVRSSWWPVLLSSLWAGDGRLCCVTIDNWCFLPRVPSQLVVGETSEVTCRSQQGYPAPLVTAHIEVNGATKDLQVVGQHHCLCV